MSYQFLNYVLSDYLAHTPIKAIFATDASQSEEKERYVISVFSPTLDWYFSFCLPDFMPTFIPELFAIIPGIR